MNNTFATVLRRLIAYMVDYAFILLFMAGLAAFNIFILGVDIAPPGEFSDKWVGHFIGFLSLTLPVWLYFTVLEQSNWQATIGKRLLGIRIQSKNGSKASFAQAGLRNAIKFLPWEISHAAIWYVPGRPFLDPMPVLNLSLCIISLAIVCVYIMCLFIGAGRTPYDLVARTLVRVR